MILISVTTVSRKAGCYLNDFFQVRHVKCNVKKAVTSRKTISPRYDLHLQSWGLLEFIYIYFKKL